MNCFSLPFYELNEDGVSLWIGKLCKNGCFVQNIINESTKKKLQEKNLFQVS